MFCIHCGHDPELARKLDHIFDALKHLMTRSELMAIFDDLRAKVLKLTNAADAMDVVLTDVKSKLDNLIANGSLSDADKADLQAISTGIDTEGDKIIADTLKNTPAASQVPSP